MYNIVFISGVQQSDSVIHTYMCGYIYIFFFSFFSHMGHYRVLSRVPCAIQYVLVNYQFLYIIVCIC